MTETTDAKYALFRSQLGHDLHGVVHCRGKTAHTETTTPKQVPPYLPNILRKLQNMDINDHSCENVWSLILHQSAIDLLLRPECVLAWKAVRVLLSFATLKSPKWQGKYPWSFKWTFELEDQNRWRNWVVPLYMRSSSALRSFGSSLALRSPQNMYYSQKKMKVRITMHQFIRFLFMNMELYITCHYNTYVKYVIGT